MFVHGAWHGAWCWEDHFLGFFAAAGYECHALDLRWHGASRGPGTLRRSRIDGYVDDLAAVVSRLAHPPVLVAHSMGGLVAQRYLERHTLPGVVLLAPVPVGGAWRATARVARRNPLGFLKANLTLRLWPVVADPERARHWFFAPDMPDAEALHHWRRLQDESYLAFLDMIVFRRPRPERVDTPVLVVAAAADRLFGVTEMERTAAAYGSTAVVVASAAHDLMLDARWEQAARAARAWIEAPAGSGPAAE